MTSSNCAYGQVGQEKALNADFYPEPGCPIQLTKVQSLLEMDPFGAPTASKIYLTYMNNSAKSINAVKFRCRYADNQGKDKGTFHAPDSCQLEPGGSRSHKWKREGGLHPGIAAFQIRVLQVKFVDGSLWESTKMAELATPKSEDEQDGPSTQYQAPPQMPNPANTPLEIQQQQVPPQMQAPYQQNPYQQTPAAQPGQQPGANQGFDKSKELPW